MTNPVSATLRARLGVGALLALALGGCQSTSVAPKPALLLEPNDQVRAELKGIVSNALNTEVALSQQVLTQEPLLIIDAASRPRSMEAAGAQGSWRDRPDHFELYLVNGQCRLRHRQSEREWPVPGATCVAVNGER